MRPVLHGLAFVLLAYPAATASARQQGSIQVSASAQGITGDPAQLAGQQRLEPDVGVSWLQPGTRFGVFQMELRGTKRGELAHLGRAYLSLRELKFRGLTWTLEGGDTFFTPAIGDYRFSNLFTPSLTFTGGALAGRSARTNVGIVAGRTTAARNIFGTDADTLGQTLLVGRAGHRLTDRLELTARASRVQTGGLREFTFSIADSRQAGGGAKLHVTPAIQVVADASVVEYRREGLDRLERDASLLAGASFLLPRGWVQLNASRFSPGEFPALHYPLGDREGVFAAAEYDVWSRVRVFAGWEAFESNLDPGASAESSAPIPLGSGARGFGGVRLQTGARSALAFRVEDGDRVSTPVRGGGRGSDSDTGSWSAEWQMAVGAVNTFTRYSRRESVDAANADASYNQHDGSIQAFVTLSRSAQIFGIATMTRHEMLVGGNTYWQAGGGAQIQVPRRSLWMRGEATASRNADILTRSFVPRESFSVGVNGQLTARTAIALNVYADRAPALFSTGMPWTTRSTVRLTHTVPTRAMRVSSGGVSTAAGRSRGTGSVTGGVFADWNANGTLDAGEAPLEGIPVRVGSIAAATTTREGEFRFVNVPAGLQRVGLDTTALPIDYDPPAIAEIEVELDRGDTRRVTFGLIPLGSIQGRVVRDANGNGRADDAEESLDGAVLILDGGMRSEQVRRGRFRFDAVRSGEHKVKLLVDSLPAGATIAGEAEVPVALTRDRLQADLAFAVAVEKRPEIRKVFPPKGGGAAPDAAVRTPARPPAARQAASLPAQRTARERLPREGVRQPYAVQVAALSSLPKASALAAELTAAGLPAYVVPANGSRGPFRVRVGGYESRDAADKAAAEIGKARGIKPWVVVESGGKTAAGNQGAVSTKRTGTL